MPRLGDVYGRKTMVTINSVVGFFLYLGVMFAPNIYFLGAVLFISGVFNSIRTNIGYMYMIELMPQKNRSLMGTVWNLVEGTINLIATFWLMNVSTYWFSLV